MTDKRNFSIIGKRGYYSGKSPSSIAKKYLLKHSEGGSLTFSLKDVSKNRIYDYEGKVELRGGKKYAIISRIKKGGQDATSVFNECLKNIFSGNIETIIGNNKSKIDFFKGPQNLSYSPTTIIGERMNGTTNKIIFRVFIADQQIKLKKSDFVENYTFNAENKQSFQLCFKNESTGPKCKQERKGFHMETYSLFSRHLQQSYNILNKYLASLYPGQNIKKDLDNKAFFLIGRVTSSGSVEIADVGGYYYFVFMKFSTDTFTRTTLIEIPFVIKIETAFLQSLASQAVNFNKEILNIKMDLNFLTNFYPNITQIFDLLKNVCTQNNKRSCYSSKLLVGLENIALLKDLKEKYGMEALIPAASQLFYSWRVQNLADKGVVYIDGETVKHQSYNLASNTNNISTLRLEPSQDFAKGTMFLKMEPEFKKVNTKQILVNCIEVIRKASGIILRSFRYGTPIAPKGTKASVVYNKQTELVKSFIGDKNAIIVSLLDYVGGNFAMVDYAKANETMILRTEMEQYSMDNNYGKDQYRVFLNMSINNNVNFGEDAKYIKSASIQQEPAFRNMADKNVENLGNWISTLIGNFNTNNNRTKYGSDLKSVYNAKKCLTILYNKFYNQNFRENILLNKIPESLKQNPFINKLRQALDGKKEVQVNVASEVTRLIMFVYLSVIIYLMNYISQKEGKRETVLLYHCKSGQDRTGTLYAVNQMVNEVLTNNYDRIIGDINADSNFDFIKLYENYFENTTACIKYLLFSYNVTFISTGFPGLKWGLGKKQMGIGPVENRFSYLLLGGDTTYARLFEGASFCRKS